MDFSNKVISSLWVKKLELLYHSGQMGEKFLKAYPKSDDVIWGWQ